MILAVNDFGAPLTWVTGCWRKERTVTRHSVECLCAGSTLRDVTEGVGLVANERTLACACLADRLLLQVMHKRMQLFTMDAALAPDQGTPTNPVQRAIPYINQPIANIKQYQTSNNAVHQPIPNTDKPIQYTNQQYTSVHPYHTLINAKHLTILFLLQCRTPIPPPRQHNHKHCNLETNASARELHAECKHV